MIEEIGPFFESLLLFQTHGSVYKYTTATTIKLKKGRHAVSGVEGELEIA